MPVMNLTEVRRILRKNGFVYERSNGDHDIYYKDGKHISIPVHKTMHPMMWKRLMKENNLKVGDRNDKN